jgi:hypothetical protein
MRKYVKDKLFERIKDKVKDTEKSEVESVKYEQKGIIKPKLAYIFMEEANFILKRGWLGFPFPILFCLLTFPVL